MKRSLCSSHRRVNFTLVIALLLWSVFLPTVAYAEPVAQPSLSMDEYQKEWLKGVHSIQVVAGIDGDWRNDEGTEVLASRGISDNWLRDYVEMRLRMIGIEVQREPTKSSALLSLIVSVCHVQDVSAITFSLEVQQSAKLDGTRSQCLATTWSKSSTMASGDNIVDKSIRRELEDQVNAFVNAYLAANPLGVVAPSTAGNDAVKAYERGKKNAAPTLQSQHNNSTHGHAQASRASNLVAARNKSHVSAGADEKGKIDWDAEAGLTQRNSR